MVCQSSVCLSLVSSVSEESFKLFNCLLSTVSPSPTVAADNCSVVTAREIRNITAEFLKMNIKVERDPGISPSGRHTCLSALSLFQLNHSKV